MAHRTIGILCVLAGLPLAGLGFYVMNRLDDEGGAPFRAVVPGWRGLCGFLGLAALGLGLILALIFGPMFFFA